MPVDLAYRGPPEIPYAWEDLKSDREAMLEMLPAFFFVAYAFCVCSLLYSLLFLLFVSFSLPLFCLLLVVLPFVLLPFCLPSLLFVDVRSSLAFGY